MAIMTRWRIPPESSCGYWRIRRSGAEMPTLRMMSSARARASASVTSRWQRTASAIWSPMRKAGFSEVIGSWKIIAMRSPRSPVRLSGCARSSRWPSNSAAPSIRTPLAPRRPMTASEVTLLPLPDSPTMASVSPGVTARSTPEITSAEFPKVIRRSRTFSSASAGVPVTFVV